MSVMERLVLESVSLLTKSCARTGISPDAGPSLHFNPLYLSLPGALLFLSQKASHCPVRYEPARDRPDTLHSIVEMALPTPSRALPVIHDKVHSQPRPAFLAALAVALQLLGNIDRSRIHHSPVKVPLHRFPILCQRHTWRLWPIFPSRSWGPIIKTPLST